MGACASRSQHVRSSVGGGRMASSATRTDLGGAERQREGEASLAIAPPPGEGPKTKQAEEHRRDDKESDNSLNGEHGGEAIPFAGSRQSSASESWDSSEALDQAPSKSNSRSIAVNGGHGAKASIGDTSVSQGHSLRHMATSKLEEASRRRLSVSTVQAAPVIGEKQVIGTTPPSWMSGSKGPQSGKSGNLECGINEEALAAAAAGVSPSHRPTEPRRRSLIKKFTDPALQLVDERRGAIREVTCKMILDLVPNAHSSLGYFGCPSWDVQKGFDNKELSIVGSLADKTTLLDLGVGFACKKGLKPESPNQDDFFVLRVDDWAMYGVFDGHGPCGHDVSHFVHNALPFLIISDPQFEEDTPATLRRAFRKVHHLLEAASEQADAYLDCTLSGTTATVVVHRDNKLYIAHVGDSRAVMAQKAHKKCSALTLTIDHKPTLEAERARIESHGGEVRRLEGDIPYRVFVKNRMYPGLAMSRAVGDTVGAAVGVVSDPDVRVVDLHEDDTFFVLSTDGVWEFISSQECIDFCTRKPRQQVQEAAEFVAYESWRRWVEEEESVVDDITCIIVYLGNAV